ncbi:hypothetical protein VTN77DRAFT_7483 [Rasamsonia byssochlamydoides]|uniref:uncharacterized protein n=1 Tax=Rasamsonia byssochlamydoides TaxID=89139 RepID=UPI0037444503
MLASPTSDVQRRHRLHRRQNSTPVALEAAKIPSLPAQSMHRYAVHRRGMSLDQRVANLQSGQLPQEAGESISNAGIYQERLTRQGHPFDQSNISLSSSAEYQSFSQDGLDGFTNLSSSENLSNNACMGLDAFSAESQNSRNQQLQAALGHIQQQQQSMPYGSGLNHHYVNDTAWDSYLIENSALPQTFDKMVPGGIRRMSVQSDLGPYSHRPSTPTNQMNSNYFPITPATTPFRGASEFATYSQNVHGSPTKNATLLHTPQSAFMQRAKSLQGVPGSTFTQPQIDVPSPPNTAPVDFESFDVLNSQESDFESSEFQTLPQSESFNTTSSREDQRHSQASSASASSASVSFQSSPELAFMPLPGESSGKNPKVPIVPATPSRASPRKTTASPSKPKLSPRPASIDSLNLDSRIQASIAETGVTIEEIASYISGPDPEDGKWVCLHPGCDRRFGRKENIKSHIQTHLGDRQYKCDHCDKCFVRGHDLKRHAKIHTGDKPYECLCGNVFARHDALTRHRQRGMCIGGYKGVVRKTTKRGRPKKNRPDMEERQDKAARTRERVAAKSIASSASGSESSCSSPPAEVFENLSIRASSPVATFEPNNYCLPSDVFTFTPPASPGYSAGNKPSPVRSHRSYTPSTDGGNLSRSPSKQGLEQIPEEVPELPPISEAAGCFDAETAIQSTANTLSSPHTVPTLTGSSTESDIDIFINQDAASSFDKSQLPSFNESEMSSFSEFGTGSNFAGDYELFQGKALGSSLNDDFLVEFDDQPADVFFQ